MIPAAAAAVAVVARDLMAGLLLGGSGGSGGAQAFVPAGRREALLSATLGLAGSTLGAERSQAYGTEANRQAGYIDKAIKLNAAVDWLLFELKPLVYPTEMLVTKQQCEAMGQNCPDVYNMREVYNLYARPPGGGALPSLSKPERDIFAPLNLLATSALLDPDSSDELNDLALQFETQQTKLGAYAREGDVVSTRKLYDASTNVMNTYFRKVNGAMGVPQESEYYLREIPAYNDKVLDTEYWQGRQRKYIVKKKVDAVSKGSKTARFYAKSIFGDDAVSWDPRGDRGVDFGTNKDN